MNHEESNNAAESWALNNLIFCDFLSWNLSWCSVFAILKGIFRKSGRQNFKNSIHLSNEDKFQTKMASTGYFPETGKIKQVL